MIDKATRFRVLANAKFTCFYCGRRAPEVKLEVDHVDPRANGGSGDPENLVAACFDCNRGKGHRVLGAEARDTFPVGQHCLILADDGKADYQGAVTAIVGDGLAVRCYDWIVGAPSPATRIFPIGDWSRWRFYESDAKMAWDLRCGGKARHDVGPSPLRMLGKGKHVC